MFTFLIENLWEIFFGLLSAGALGFCRYLWNRTKKLEEMQKADQNRQTREMILDEIGPIIDEISLLHSQIDNLEITTKKDFLDVRQEEESAHKLMYGDLAKIQESNDKNFTLIVNSYKFRLIQLCKTHLKDGFITEDDFEQFTEMYKLYHGLGGNGQAQEYYDKVLKLEIK